jgi:hypothetical protein
LVSKKPEDGYEWSFETELEGSLYGGQGDRNAARGGETPPTTNAEYCGQGDYGEVSPASEEPDDGHEWSWEAEVEKWSKGSQGDASEARGGQTPRLGLHASSSRVVTSGILRPNWRNGRSWLDDGPDRWMDGFRFFWSLEWTWSWRRSVWSCPSEVRSEE